MKNLFWVATNLYGKLFGWPFLAPVHHAVISFSLHGLGYGNMYREKWTGEEWFLKNILAPTKPEVIFDVGANVGSYSAMLIKYTAAKIYAFEPNPSSYQRLLALPERVIKVQSAVSDSTGLATLHYKFDFDGKASLDSRVRKGNTVEVALTTLEAFSNVNDIQKIDYVKIDTEGFEREVISGLGLLRPKFIQFEFNINHLQRNCTFHEISELLPEYIFYRLLPNGWLRINQETFIDNIFIFSNIVAVKK